MLRNSLLAELSRLGIAAEITTNEFGMRMRAVTAILIVFSLS